MVPTRSYCQEMTGSDRRKASSSKSTRKQHMNGAKTSDSTSFPGVPKNVSLMSPESFFERLMASRGVSFKTFKLMPQLTEPSEEQIRHYDNDLVWAVRESDLPTISELALSGRTMAACNRYSESIMHMACRRSSLEVVRFMHEHGASFDQIDDYGRTPLHDACWRSEPYFELIAYILDRRKDLLRGKDARGATPLDYVPREHWDQWRKFIDANKEKYWSAELTSDSLSDNESPEESPPKSGSAEVQW